MPEAPMPPRTIGMRVKGGTCEVERFEDLAKLHGEHNDGPIGVATQVNFHEWISMVNFHEW